MPKIWAEDLDAHRRLVLERLLDAFAELLVERGYDGVTMSAVAARAGLARSAIYNYAADKHRLLFLHLQRAVAAFVDEVGQAVAAAASPPEQLAIYIAATMRSFGEEAGAGMDLQPSLSPEDQAELFVHLRPTQRMAHDIIVAGLADGSFSGGSAEELTTLVSATLGGYRSLIGRGAAEPEAASRLVTRTLLAGMVATPPG